MDEGKTTAGSYAIDAVMRAPDGATALILMHHEPWDGSDRELLHLQGRINTYLAFALDGELTRQFPGTRGHPVRIELDCSETPRGRIAALLRVLGRQVAEEQGIQLSVRVFRPPAAD